jgi:hypothetical protein
MSVPLHLPTGLGELKAGDRVALQVLYCPDGFDLLPRDEASQVMQHLASGGGNGAVVVPLLSNRIEIAVTKDLLEGRVPK